MMPRGDGTGPMGMGPMSGRGMGFCAGFGRPGYMHWGFGPPFRGYAPGYAPAYAPPYYQRKAGPVYDEKAYLKKEAELIKEQLSQIEARINELEASEGKE